MNDSQTRAEKAAISYTRIDAIEGILLASNIIFLEPASDNDEPDRIS